MEIRLGTRPEEKDLRDAVHVPVVAMVCQYDELMPGTHVNAQGEPKQPVVGIVDPFRELPVTKGDRYWLCLYPGTVTAMQHRWKHPAFEESEESEKDAAIKWLTKFASHVRYTYPEFMTLMNDFWESGDRDSFGMYGESMDEFRSHWPQICLHYRTVTGRLIDPENYVSFHCSC
jgi:hypothetical protein